MKEYINSAAFIRDFNEGHHAAFNAVFEKYFSVIYAFCRKLVQQSDEAEDIAIESFVKLYRYHDKINSHAHIRSFLYVTSRNSCMQYFRDEKKKEAAKLNFEKMWYEQDYIRFNDKLDGMYLEAVRTAFEKLPKRSKELVDKLYFKGMDHQTAANQMKIKLDTLYVLRSRTVSLLRKLINSDGVSNGLLLLMFYCFLRH